MTSVILWVGGGFVKALIGVGAKNTDGLRGIELRNTPMDNTEQTPAQPENGAVRLDREAS